MKKLRKLPFVLAFALALFAGACSEVPIEPVGSDDDDDIIIKPPPPRSSSQEPVVIDTLTIG
jgi:hypothetical protein